MKGLVEKRVSLELQDQEGNTPLHVACEHGFWDCANEMIHNASPSKLAYVLEAQNWRGESHHVRQWTEQRCTGPRWVCSVCAPDMTDSSNLVFCCSNVLKTPSEAHCSLTCTDKHTESIFVFLWRVYWEESSWETQSHFCDVGFFPCVDSDWIMRFLSEQKRSCQNKEVGSKKCPGVFPCCQELPVSAFHNITIIQFSLCVSCCHGSEAVCALWVD